MKSTLITMMAMLAGSGFAIGDGAGEAARNQTNGVAAPRSQRSRSRGRPGSCRLRPRLRVTKHTHPGEEIIYVLEGTLEYHVDGKPTATYKPGEVLMVPTGTIHWVKNIGSGNGAELATYVVEKGKPLLTLVK